MTEPPTPQLGSEPTSRILITGGTGFVGSAIRAALAGRPLRLLVRDRARVRDIGPEVELVEGDVTRPETLRGAADGCAAVVHLVAIIEEGKGPTFDGVIRQGTEHVLAEAQRAGGVRHFVHMSALGARDDARFPYLQAKWRAEEAVRASGLPFTIFRPSVIFGPGDGFVTVLARVVRTFPIVPVVGDGRSKFQPTAVGEVAAAFARALDDPAARGQTYELGGGKVYAYEELIDAIAAHLGKRKPKAHLPVALMKAAVALSRPLPRPLRPPVTSEQLKMLALDNCTDQNALPALLGRAPTRLEDALDYI